MSTRSRDQQHYGSTITATQIYDFDSRSEGNIDNVTTSQSSSLYQAITSFAVPPAPAYTQPAAWQSQPNNAMIMGMLHAWQTDQILNNIDPVLFDWGPRPASLGLDFQPNSSPMRAPESVRFDDDFMRACQDPFEARGGWQAGWAEESRHADEHVRPSVETVREAATIDLPALSPAKAVVEYVPPSTKEPARLHSIQVTGQGRAPTSTVDPGDDTAFAPLSPFATTPPLLQTPSEPSSVPQSMSPGAQVPHEPNWGGPAVFKTQSANAKRGHYACETWEHHKSAIKRLYIDEGRPLREVIRIMESDHGFPATQRMYKARFKQWGFVKNNTEKVVSQILRTKFERDAAGKLSQFTRNGKEVRLHSYLQRKGLTEYDLVDLPATTTTDGTDDNALPLLAQVRCRTPPPVADLRLPDRLRFQETLVMSFKRSFQLWRQQEAQQERLFGFGPGCSTPSIAPTAAVPVFPWRVAELPHLRSLLDSARFLRSGDGARGAAALHQAFRALQACFLASLDATASLYFFFHRQSRPWQEDARIALAVWKFLAAYAASAARHPQQGNNGATPFHYGSHPLLHAFKLMYEVIQAEGVVGLRALLAESADAVADELERAFGREHWLKELIWHRCFPEKSKQRQLQLVRALRRNGPAKKIVRRLY